MSEYKSPIAGFATAGGAQDTDDHKSQIVGFVTSMEDTLPADPVGTVGDTDSQLNGLGHFVRVFGNEQPKRKTVYRVHAVVTDWSFVPSEPEGHVWTEISFIKAGARTVLHRDRMYSSATDLQESSGPDYYYDLTLPEDTDIASLQVTVAVLPAGVDIDNLVEWVLGVVLTVVNIPVAAIAKALPQIDTMHLPLDSARASYLDAVGMALKGLLQFK